MYFFIGLTPFHTLQLVLYSWFVMLKLRQNNTLNRNSQINQVKCRNIFSSRSEGKVLYFVILIDRWPSGFYRGRWLIERSKLQPHKSPFEHLERRYFLCKRKIILYRNALTSINSKCQKFRVGRKHHLAYPTGIFKHLERWVRTVVR